MHRLPASSTLILLFALLITPCATAQQPNIDSFVARIRAVDTEGKGHRDAIAAYRELSQASAEQIPAILAGFPPGRPLAENWLRAAVDTIAERQLQQQRPLPAEQLEAFVRDTGHAPRARSLAYQWLLRVDPTARDRLLPGLLDDPSGELRRAAVALAMEQAVNAGAAADRTESLAAYRRALSAARDLDQVNAIAARLKDLGEKVDLPRHFGFVTQWQLIGPFDNTDRRGHNTVYAPEKALDAEAVYDGPFGKLAWQPHVSSDRFGLVDLNAVLAMKKQVTGYAWADFLSDRVQEVEFRWKSYNATKLWLNGQLIADNEIYHSGARFDQYRARGQLKEGTNTLLLKVSQNEQTQSWARYWQFSFRVCDANGTAVPAADDATRRITVRKRL